MLYTRILSRQTPQDLKLNLKLKLKLTYLFVHLLFYQQLK